jgi:hypothetical protein
LFEKTNPRHFSLEIHPIDLKTDADTPPMGIGIESERRIETKSGAVGRTASLLGQPGQTTSYITERILIDPMTREVISRLTKYKDDGTPMISDTGGFVYETNDYWFVLRAKFLWLEAPKELLALTAGQ